jgi:uncharacterized membrane protein
MEEQRIKVLFVGETWLVCKFHVKGFDIVPLGGYEDFSIWPKNALKKYPDVNIVHLPNHIALGGFPKTVEELQNYDILVLSDVGRNTLTFYPEMFKVPMGPNKLELIKNFVKKGGGLVMCGGWMSFQGFRGMANYHGTPIEEILPVEISNQDDRVETPEGVKPKIVNTAHPILRGIPHDNWPLFLGYNKLKTKDKATLIAKFGDNPFITVCSYEKGRTMAFASDISPHWGTAFAKWEYYPVFWYQTIKWLSKKI